MTRRLYNEDSYIQSFRAEVVSCAPHKENWYQVVLDRTAFFPEGGGQSSDRGYIEDAQVIDVQEVGEEVVHIVDKSLEVGASVDGQIDWVQRFDRMQQHTAEHITSGIVARNYGFHNVGFHLNSEIVTMDFDGVITRAQGNQLEEEVNAAVVENVPVHVLYPTKEVLEEMEYRSKIEIEGQVRIVNVEHYDTCACCAPHVRRTGEIGMVKFSDIQSHRGGVRITMVCGKRALRDYQEKATSTKLISGMLSAKENEIGEAVQRLKDDIVEEKSGNCRLQNLLVDYKVAAVTEAKSHRLIFEADLAVEFAREMVNRLVKQGDGVVAVFLENGTQGYQYMIGSATEDVRNIGKMLNQQCNGRGGGKPVMVQGSVCATREEILAVWGHMFE